MLQLDNEYSLSFFRQNVTVLRFYIWNPRVINLRKASRFEEIFYLYISSKERFYKLKKVIFILKPLFLCLSDKNVCQ